MKFVQVTHGTREEWLQWRQNGVGSSDVPVVMGVSRFKTYNQLLAEKINPVAGEDQSNAFIKDRGNKIEIAVRKLYEEKMNMLFPAMSCQSIEYPFSLATLDGIEEGHNLFIEIKLLSSVKPGTIKETEGMKKWNAAKDGRIPEDYYPQIQHQLSVTGVPACVFLGLKETRGKPYSMEDIVEVTVLPDEQYIKAMNDRIQAFWDKVLQGRQNE